MSEQKEPTCTWAQEDDDTRAWSTACGNMFLFSEGGPKENEMAYCSYCGGKLLTDNGKNANREKLVATFFYDKTKTRRVYSDDAKVAIFPPEADESIIGTATLYLEVKNK